MKTQTLFACEKCGFESKDETEVAACEAVEIQRSPVQIGDIVIVRSNGYGWWRDKNGNMRRDDEIDTEWFHIERGDPNSRNHLTRAQLGFPKFVVVGKAMYSDPVVGGNGYGPGWRHRECALLYSPKHANFKTGTAYVWIPPDYGVRKLGEVSPEDLAIYQAAVNGRKANLI